MTLFGIYTIKIFIQFHRDKYIKCFYGSKERDEVKNGGKGEGEMEDKETNKRF